MTVLWTKMQYLHMFHSCLQWTLRFTEDVHGIQCTWKLEWKTSVCPLGFFPHFSFLKKSVQGGHLQRFLPKISSKAMISSKQCPRPSWETWRDKFFFFTAQLQLRVLFGKQRKVHPWGMRAGQPQRRGHEETILIHRKKPSLSKISTEASIFT